MKKWVCVASGPSLTLAQVRHVGLAKAAGRVNVIAVNDCIYPCWYADIGYGSDVAWWNAHNGVPGFKGEKITIDIGRPLECEGVSFINRTGTTGLCTDGENVTTGGNSGHAAVHLAYNRGARTIYLVGYDFIGDKDGVIDNHWFGKHKGRLNRGSAGQQKNRIRSFAELTKAMQKNGVKFFNCTLNTAIDWLPTATTDSLAEGLIKV